MNDAKRKEISGVKNQMPGYLKRLDDPFGITWRIYNLIKRFDLKFILKFVGTLFQDVDLKSPIFIIGMPRSGTTTLSRLLENCDGISSIGREAHDIWRLYHHPRYTKWSGDYVGPDDIKLGEKKVVYSLFKAAIGNNRLLDKTADNLIRIEYLHELFPDATFIVIKRNPCDVINSLINAWKDPSGKFRSYYVPKQLKIPEYNSERRWCLTLITNWKDLTNSSIPEIAYEQWKTYVKGIIKARQIVSNEKWIEIYLEDMVSNPRDVFKGVCDKLDITLDEKKYNESEKTIDTPINALSPKKSDKWKSQNLDSIIELLPKIAPLSKEIGYQINEQSGDMNLLDSNIK